MKIRIKTRRLKHKPKPIFKFANSAVNKNGGTIMNIIICVLLVISIIISAAALITGLKGKQGNDIALLDQK